MELTIDAVREKINNRITTSDIVMAILSQLDGENFEKSPVSLHKVFFDLSIDDEFKELLEDLHFNTFFTTPYSENLEQIILRLEASTILSTANPSYKTYKIQKVFLLESFEKLPPKKQKLVKKCAKIVSQKLKIKPIAN